VVYLPLDKVLPIKGKKTLKILLYFLRIRIRSFGYFSRVFSWKFFKESQPPPVASRESLQSRFPHV